MYSSLNGLIWLHLILHLHLHLEDALIQSDLQIIYTHFHTPTAESTMQGNSQLDRSSQGEASRSGTTQHSARRRRGSN